MSHSSFASLWQAAHAYALRGWLVFPCVPGGKIPATPNGFYAATTNPATIARWWRANPNYNIGLRCGAGSRLWVVDRDDRTGGAETLARLLAEHSPLPPTLVGETGDGAHLYFATDRDLPSTTGKIAAGVDSRGRGGYVVAPPSSHPSGKVYRWIIEQELAAPPKWLVDLACKQSNAEGAITARRFNWSAPTTGDAYGHAALASEVAKVASTPRGARNNQLNVSAFCLFQLVAGGVLAEAEVVAGLTQACQHNGLWSDDGPRQCMATIASGAKAGLEHPRCPA